jgi:hypothetical protein
MAASTANATQYTKFISGGEASANYIPDGYIKSVEKIWLDSYTFTSAIPSLCTVTIASVPSNKKITDVKVFFPSLSTGASGTGTTVSLGITSSAAKFLSAGEAYSGVLSLSANDGIGYVTSSNPTLVTVLFDRIATTTTAGTITTIVKYT